MLRVPVENPNKKQTQLNECLYGFLKLSRTHFHKIENLQISTFLSWIGFKFSLHDLVLNF